MFSIYLEGTASNGVFGALKYDESLLRISMENVGVAGVIINFKAAS